MVEVAHFELVPRQRGFDKRGIFVGALNISNHVRCDCEAMVQFVVLSCI